MHLFFLLARYAGLRSSEILAFPVEARLDAQTGFLQIKNRKLFLPPGALRPIRRILSLPEARENDFLQLDAGFLRRTFYELGRIANLPPEACAPRALRYARAMELLEMRMSIQLVGAWLGMDTPAQLARLAANQKRDDKNENNFIAIVRDLETDSQAGKIFLTTEGGLALTAIAPIGDLAALEPVCGKPVSVTVSRRMIFPSAFPIPAANRLNCMLASLTRNIVENRICLKTQAGFTLVSLLDASVSFYSEFNIGDRLDVYIPASALKLAAL